MLGFKYGLNCFLKNNELKKATNHQPIPIGLCVPLECDSQFEILKWLGKVGPFSLNFRDEMRPSLLKIQKLAVSSSGDEDPKNR